ncbi:MAG: CoA pyrophosphatase [Dokdonella sp.]
MNSVELAIARIRAAIRPLTDVPVDLCQPAIQFADLIPENLRPAAVLVPIVIRANSLSLLLTRRTEALRQHAGQISFPGGAIDLNDGDAINAALRETWEETGIAPSFVEPIGYLDRLDTISAFSITPVVAVVSEGFTIRPEPGEVAEIFEVPLDFILHPGRMHSVPIEWRGQVRHVDEFHYDSRRVWGATATILRNLIERLEKRE